MVTVMEGAASENTVVERPVWTLTPAEFAATRAKIDKVNERAARRGFTGRFEVTGTRDEVKRDNGIGLPVTEVVYRVTVTGEAPRYHGWGVVGCAGFHRGWGDRADGTRCGGD